MSNIQKLGSLAVIAAGQGAPQGSENYSNNGTPFIKAGDITDLAAGKSELDVQKVSLETATTHKLKLFPKGTVLFAKSGMSCMKGIVHVLGMDCYVVSHLACITPHSIESSFLKYYLEFNRPNKLVKDAAYPSISLADIAEMDISVPAEADRKQIIASLDAICELIRLRKLQLKELDEFVKSRFIELFGDPVINPYGYDVCTLQELIDNGTILYHLDGNHGGDYPRSEEFTENGIPYISANCIVEGAIDFKLAKHLPPERAAKLRKGIAVNGDVLFAHNATVGPVVILHTIEEKVILSTSLTAYRCNQKAILPGYLKAYMQSDGFVRQYSAEMKQTTRNQVPITAQKKYLFIVPPMDLQEQFAAFVEQTDKSKYYSSQSYRYCQQAARNYRQEWMTCRTSNS